MLEATKVSECEEGVELIPLLLVIPVFS